MAVDPARIFQGFIGVHWLWMGPSFVIVGWSHLPGDRSGHDCAYQSNGPAHGEPVYVARKIGMTRRLIVKNTDMRVQLTNEVLSGIRLIKSGWEKLQL